MRPISGSFFVDSNIVLYLLDHNDSRKKEIASALIEEVAFISPQVIFECLNVCIKKFKMERPLVAAFLTELMNASYIQSENESTVNQALIIFHKYLMQPFDSKIIASALEAGCNTLYSEDMQHGLIIEKRLTIINPFL
ncbi:PIN domain-containing protein [Dyadobacter psychrotolerans]|uniref:PIN domain-containing protein n=1 Tax=Dyadobacter psychrotolerans TaxID=2541721 RepID=A0A4R5DY06_9BACT|nr:PIN domain-containing protein [Dyadobacter psychrotolerans]TDE17071.1 PIN domain-containing protein [Dyadobacter psychrotolerans]